MGVFLAAEAWRRQYGRAVRYAALRDGGGDILQHNRAGMDPYPLLGWKKTSLEEGGAFLYEGPHGEVFEDLREVYEYVVASKSADAGVDETKIHLSVLQHFLTDCCSEKEERAGDGARCVVTTGTLEDWLHRGSHPILTPMGL